MNTPPSILATNDAWKQYTSDELAGWVHLLVKRANMHTEIVKVAKALTDASNYLDMLIQHGTSTFTVFGESSSVVEMWQRIAAIRDAKIVAVAGEALA